MFKKIVYYTLILISTAGCVVTPSDAEIKTKEPESTVYVTSPTVGKPATPKAEKPPIEEICPDNAMIPLSKIGLPGNIILLGVHEDEVLGGNLNTPLKSDILVFSGIRPEPNRIEKVRSVDNESKIINILVSPDGLWLALLRWNAVDNQETLWTSSITGEEQRMITSVSPRQKISWISASEILIVGVLNESDYEGQIPEKEMRPLLSIDPFSSVIESLDPLPEGAIYVYSSFHFMTNNHYALYYMSDSQEKNYFLYDYARKISTRVFSWVNDIDNSTSVGIRPNGLYYVEHSAGPGIDFAVDLSIEEIMKSNSYDNIMKHLELEGSESLEITSMLANLTKNNLLILTSDSADYEKPTPVYWFDYKTNILKDYCVNLGSIVSAFSPDEQFAAFTVDEGTDTAGYHILLLNLKTGYYSMIEHAKAIGFGILK